MSQNVYKNDLDGYEGIYDRLVISPESGTSLADIFLLIHILALKISMNCDKSVKR